MAGSIGRNKTVGKNIVLAGMQAGDVPVTYADSTAPEKDYGFTPKIGIREGLRNFAEWYGGFYRQK